MGVRQTLMKYRKMPGPAAPAAERAGPCLTCGDYTLQVRLTILLATSRQCKGNGLCSSQQLPVRSVGASARGLKSVAALARKCRHHRQGGKALDFKSDAKTRACIALCGMCVCRLAYNGYADSRNSVADEHPVQKSKDACWVRSSRKGCWIRRCKQQNLFAYRSSLTMQLDLSQHPRQEEQANGKAEHPARCSI